MNPYPGESVSDYRNRLMKRLNLLANEGVSLEGILQDVGARKVIRPYVVSMEIVVDAPDATAAEAVAVGVFAETSAVRRLTVRPAEPEPLPGVEQASLPAHPAAPVPASLPVTP